MHIYTRFRDCSPRVLSSPFFFHFFSSSFSSSFFFSSCCNEGNKESGNTATARICVYVYHRDFFLVSEYYLSYGESVESDLESLCSLVLLIRIEEDCFIRRDSIEEEERKRGQGERIFPERDSSTSRRVPTAR